jgi:hypothetical protein
MKIVSLLLGTLLVYNPVDLAAQAAPAPGTAQVQTQETPQAAKIKAKVQKRGIGKKSLVRAKLVNGTDVKGYISKIEETSFTVTDKRSGQTTTIPYADVQKIRGPGWSKTDTIVVSAVAAGVLVLVLIPFCLGTQSC